MRRPFYHLTKEDREVIYEGIIESISLSDIAFTLGKSPTSISREVKRNRSHEIRGTFWDNNICLHRKECTRTKLCKPHCKKTKYIRRDVLDDIVVKECQEVLTDESIAGIAKAVSTLVQKEANSPYVIQLKKSITQVDAAIENLLNPLKQGKQQQSLRHDWQNESKKSSISKNNCGKRSLSRSYLPSLKFVSS